MFRLNGVITAITACILWGILPIYWKKLGNVPAYEILLHRIFWSFVFMSGIVLIAGLLSAFKADFKKLIEKPKHFLLLFVASVLVSANWLTYIWAVNDNRILETSLGYYIQPLTMVLLGIIFLGERLRFWQIVAICLALLGVLNMVWNLGYLPWVSLALTLTMGFYNLFKKYVGMNVFSGMLLETSFIAPFALFYIAKLNLSGTGYSLDLSLTTLLLICTGLITVVPLLLFAHSINTLPLNVLGVINYLTPTITFLMGVFVYNEPFTHVHMVTFSLIWLALLIFTFANTKPFVALEKRILQKEKHSL